MESVDLRSEIRKADAVLPVFARAGQRSDTLKRVARRGRCRLLFRVGVQHICGPPMSWPPLHAPLDDGPRHADATCPSDAHWMCKTCETRCHEYNARK